MILLDTHVILWIEAEPKKLSVAARKALENSDNEFYVSSISAFEIALKVRRGFIQLPMSPENWFREVCAQRGFRELAVDSGIAASSALLPEIHRDPCDRILITTAKLHTLRLMTADSIIPGYPGIDVIW